MLKRLFSVLLCMVLATAAFTLTAYGANKTDTPAGDIKLYADREDIEVGDIVTVTAYLEDITVSAGIVGVDFPLSYDKTRLSFIKLDCIYPDEWDGYGEFFGHAVPDEEPWYLRSLPDAGDLAENEAYRITDSKKIGFSLTFKALEKGEAYVAVEDVGNNKIMLVAIEGDQVNNYGANGMTLKLDIADVGGNTTDSSADLSTDVDSSVDTSIDVSVDVSGDVSVDVSGDPSEDSSADQSTDQSGEVSAPVIDDNSAPDQSGESGEAVADGSSEEASTGNEASEESSATTDDKKDGGSKLSGFLVPALIVLAVGALVGTGLFLFVKKSSNKAEEE